MDPSLKRGTEAWLNCRIASVLAQALREHPEKLAILEFPLYIAPTLVTRSIESVRAFHATHQDIILKPLAGVLGGLSAYAGSALMGDGSVLMVLNVKEMV